MSDPVSRIQLLPDHLINQIAAGEVIERPASVVKELMENSLDAGASQLEIEIEKGGARLIRIRDNGCGLTRDEIPLALCRHATSKIHSLQDLETVSSLGFRGEALASIASVSRLEICSRPAEQQSAWKIRVSSDQQTGELQPAAHPTGTTITVSDLFYNTPARRKFLRTEQTEYQHIMDLVKRLALSCYGTGVRLLHNRRQVLNLAPVNDPQSHINRVQKVLGSAFCERAIVISSEVEGLSLQGWLGHPDAARSQSDMQYFFLNGRMVRDKRINHAIRMAFDEAIYPGRYPCYLLYLQIDPEQIDVNVHPAKSEVRFSEARRVHDFIVSTLRRSLGGTQQRMNEARQSHPVLRQTTVGRRGSGSGRQQRQTAAFYAASNDHAARDGHQAPGEIKEAPAVQEFTLGQALTCLDQAYILSAVGQQFCLTNIRLASQALVGALLRTAFEENRVRSQPLLMPLSLALQVGQARALQQHAEIFPALGIEFDLIGSDSVILRSMPALLRGADMQQVCSELIASLDTLDASATPLKQAESLISVLMRHGVNSPDDVNTREGLNALLRRYERAGLTDRPAVPVFYRYFQAEDLQAFIESP